MARDGLLLLACLALGACTTPRYVGAISADGTYVNRGYGIVAQLGKEGVLERWTAIDPQAPDSAPALLRPRFSESPIDVDGDGHLDVLERTGHLEPPLRLLSKTATAAVIDLDVRILGGNLVKAPLDALLFDALLRLVPSSSAAASLALKKVERLKLPGGFDARIAEVTTRNADGHPREIRILFADQSDFEAEEKVLRRQLVTVLLSAPKLDDTLRADHGHVVKSLLLSRQGSSTTTKEQW